jgi:hypothetical protein
MISVPLGSIGRAIPERRRLAAVARETRALRALAIRREHITL